ERRRRCLGALYRSSHRRPVAAYIVVGSVDDHLWRIDIVIVALASIVALSLRVSRIGKRVAPAEVIPIIDVERNRDHAFRALKLFHESVRRRTGRTALAREELDHNRPRSGSSL